MDETIVQPSLGTFSLSRSDVMKTFERLVSGDQAFKSLSLEDLVKSFDHTINACFAEPTEDAEPKVEPPAATPDLVSSSK